MPIICPNCRPWSPSSDSTLMTSAPMSASITVEMGPNCHIVQSITFIPSSGPLYPLLSVFMCCSVVKSGMIAANPSKGDPLTLSEPAGHRTGPRPLVQ